MKHRTHEAAAALGVHPLTLLLYLAALKVPLEEAWPEIEEDWIEAVRGLDWKRFQHPSGEERAEAQESPAGAGPVNVPTISAGGAQIVEKLWRKRHWGDNTVSWRTLHNNYCHHVRDLEEALRELVACGYVVAEGTKGPYSLNSARKGEIERIARARVSG